MDEQEKCGCPNRLENCPNCLIVSLDGSGHEKTCYLKNTKGDYRADIYSQVPMPVFKLRIENPKDVLHILDKESGMFKVLKDWCNLF